MLDPSDAVRMITRSPTPFSPAQRDYDIIPKRHNNRTLVLCFDGTGDKFDSDVRNPSPLMLSYNPHTTSPTRHDRTPTLCSLYRY